LAAPRQAALESHVEVCAHCRGLIDEWSARENPLRDIPHDGRSLSPLAAPHDQQKPTPGLGRAPGSRALRGLATVDHVPPLDSSAGSPSDPGRSVGPQAATAAPPVPSGWPQVPGYEVLGELGRGGMGVVWKARQVNANRLVALKMLLPSVAEEPTHLARF